MFFNLLVPLADDYIVFCTGQRNLNWQYPRMERGLVVPQIITFNIALNSIPCVGLALDHLRGASTARIDALKVHMSRASGLACN